MCILVTARDIHPQYPLIVAANRDEFYTRASAPAAFWTDHRDLLGGRDLEQGGTWLAVDRAGRFAALTNIPGAPAKTNNARSRGLLIVDYLSAPMNAAAYLDTLRGGAARYDGFNLVIGTPEALHWWSNVGGEPRHLAPGVHAVSNQLMDTPWPKVARLKNRFAEVSNLRGSALVEGLLDMLADRVPSPNNELPDIGGDVDMARRVSAIFVHTAHYGTRSSTIVLWHKNGMLEFIERRYAATGRATGDDYFQFDAMTSNNDALPSS